TRVLTGVGKSWRHARDRGPLRQSRSIGHRRMRERRWRQSRDYIVRQTGARHSRAIGVIAPAVALVHQRIPGFGEPAKERASKDVKGNTSPEVVGGKVREPSTPII